MTATQICAAYNSVTHICMFPTLHIHTLHINAYNAIISEISNSLSGWSNIVSVLRDDIICMNIAHARLKNVRAVFVWMCGHCNKLTV